MICIGEEMMDIETNVFPKGVEKCVLFSFDDGRKTDWNIVEMFEHYGMKGTFHVNSGNVGKKEYLSKNDVREISRKHEIAAHTQYHINMTNRPIGLAMQDLIVDRKKLEDITGTIVKGMAFPYGKKNPELVETIQKCGFLYARESEITSSLISRDIFYPWQPTCRLTSEICDWQRKFLDTDWVRKQGKGGVMFIMGHSCELNDLDNQKRFTTLCRELSCREDVWNPSCSEYVEYVNALKTLQFTVSGTKVYNPSAKDVWIRVNGRIVLITQGETANINEFSH